MDGGSITLYGHCRAHRRGGGRDTDVVTASGEADVDVGVMLTGVRCNAEKGSTAW